MHSSSVTLTIGVLLLALCSADVLPDGRSKTPPMGWRAWHQFHKQINQSIIEGVMDALVSRNRLVDGKPTSLCDLGYCEVAVDDNWNVCNRDQRLRYHDEEGNPIVNTNRFPNLRELVDKAHRLGLKAGWYANNCLCPEKYTNELKFYEGDVKAFMKFGFDSYKTDGCGVMLNTPLYNKLLQAAKPSGVLLENCHGNKVLPWKPNATWCPWNIFRTCGDTTAMYDRCMQNLQSTIPIAKEGLSRPGCWGHPDSLQVGVDREGKLNPAETRTHFAAWAIVSSPLFLNHDVRDEQVNDRVWDLITNREILEVNQDWAGHSGTVFKQSDKTVALSPAFSVSVWQYFYKPLSNDRVAVLLINHNQEPADLSLALAEVPGAKGSVCQIRDLFKRTDLGVFHHVYTAKNIHPHDSAFIIVNCVSELATVTA